MKKIELKRIKEKSDVMKGDIITKEKISEFINLALATSKIKKIIVEQKNGDWDLRTNINLFIYGKIGSTKSTLLNEISKNTHSKKPFTDLTFPALIGSIDKLTRQLLIGACWECRNSLLLLDEFDYGTRKKDTIRVLLQLIEGGEYNKKLASFSAPTREIDGDLFYSFENGTFNIKTRFSLITTTMKYPYSTHNIELQALMSRSICIPFYPNKLDLNKIAQGFPIFKYKNIPLKSDETIIKRKDYNIIFNFVNKKSDGTNYLRIIGDCVRVFAVLKKHRYDLYNLIINLGQRKFIGTNIKRN